MWQPQPWLYLHFWLWSLQGILTARSDTRNCGKSYNLIGIPFMREAFNLTELDPKGWWMVIILGLVPLLVNELGKIYLRARRKATPTL